MPHTRTDRNASPEEVQDFVKSGVQSPAGRTLHNTFLGMSMGRASMGQLEYGPAELGQGQHALERPPCTISMHTNHHPLCTMYESLSSSSNGLTA